MICVFTAKAEKLLVNLTGSPVQVVVTRVQARDLSIALTLYPEGVGADTERPSVPSRKEIFQGAQTFDGQVIELPADGVIALQALAPSIGPVGPVSLRLKILPGTEPYPSFEALDEVGIWVTYRVEGEHLEETLTAFTTPGSRSRNLPFEAEEPNAADPRLSLVKPAHECCCVIL